MIDSSNVKKWVSWEVHLRGLLRITAATLFALGGSMKLFAFPAGIPPTGGTVNLASQLGIGAALEFVGGGMLALGLFTRPVAFLLSGEMAVAYFQFHAPKGFWPVVNGGVSAIVYCFLWLYFSAAGPGSWSLDGLLRKDGSSHSF